VFVTDLGIPPGTRIAEYVVHYANGADEIVPLINQVNVADWWAAPDHRFSFGSNTVVAWQAPNAASGPSRSDVYLYKFTWMNPRPDTPISSIDFRASGTAAAPFLIAITAE
jgi:hypothetical protein